MANGRLGWNATNAFNVLFYVGMILFIVGFSCPAWSYNESAYYSQYAGLWSCKESSYCSLIMYGKPTAAQALECVALVAHILSAVGVAFFYYVLYHSNGSNSYYDLVLKIDGMLAILGGVFGIVGGIVYSSYIGGFTYTTDRLGWASILTIAASVFTSLVGSGLVLLSIPRFKNRLNGKYEVIPSH
ncbi:unnamed protein product [Lymnaea stagnalis]|uniref:Uncharacterized protein n=1 Tax=Lymnaea stagnalis TaxID=6523 RepID=A0AAV2GYV4_LYMST